MKIPARSRLHPLQLGLTVVVIGVTSQTTVSSETPAAAFHYIGRLGMFDTAHTRSDGYQFSALALPVLAGTGSAVGTSQQFGEQDATNPIGQTAWLSDASGVTRIIGFYDAAHTAANGGHFSAVVGMNESGWIIGYSCRTDGGRTAWRADPAGTISKLGLFDSAHTGPGGVQMNTPLRIAADGSVIGMAQRFANGQEAGFTPWHTDAAGVVTPSAFHWEETAPAEVTGTGFFGETEEELVPFHANWPEVTYVSQVSATVKNLITGTIRSVGFGAEPPEPGGYPPNPVSNQIVGLNDSGVAIGYTLGSTSRGTYALTWVDDKETTTLGYNPARGELQAILLDLNEAGTVVVNSFFNESNEEATASWIASGSRLTTKIGLFDEVHTGTASPLGANFATGLSESDLVWGYALRFNGDEGADGQTAWLYAVRTGSLLTFEFSERSTDGYAYSIIDGVSPSGIVFGRYTLFDAAGTDLGERGFIHDLAANTRTSLAPPYTHVDRVFPNGVAAGRYLLTDGTTDLGDRAFVWLPDKGTRDLGTALDVPLETAGWDYLSDATVGNEAGLIAGAGVLLNSISEGVFLVKLGVTETPPQPPRCGKKQHHWKFKRHPYRHHPKSWKWGRFHRGKSK